MQLDERLMFPHAGAGDHEEVFRTVAAALLDAGYVADSYLDALLKRETDYPTGVLVPDGGVALPHTDAGHVLGDTLAVVTLDEPIPFLPMGGETDEPIDVSTLIFLVFSDPERHLSTLSSAVRAIQAPGFLAELRAAATPAELREALTNRLG